MKVTLLYFCFDSYTVELANSLVNHVDLSLIAPEKVANVCRDVLDSRICLMSFPKPRIRYPSNILAMSKMMKLIRKTNPDVLHVQETNDPWYDFTLLLNKMPPLVTTIHDVFRHPGDRQSVFGSEYTRFAALYRSQQIIVHTQEMKDILIKQFRQPSDKINVIPHGKLVTFYQREGIKTEIKPEPYTLLFFGRIWPYKGLKYLIEAMPLIIEKIPNTKLIIAGRGEDLAQYFPKGVDQQHYEIINNFIPIEDVIPLFKRSTIVVAPYIESSQSGVAALAYGLGVPIVSSAIGGLKEMIRNEEDSLLVSPGNVAALANAVIRLLSDVDLQKRFQKKIKERCQQDLNWSNISLQTLKVYQKISNG